MILICKKHPLLYHSMSIYKHFWVFNLNHDAINFELTNPSIHLFLHRTPRSPSVDTRMAPAPAEIIMRESTWYIPSPTSPDTTLLPYSASRVNTPTTKVVREATCKRSTYVQVFCTLFQSQIT